MRMPYLINAGVFFLLVCVSGAHADEVGAQKALAKAQYLLRQATTEKTELQTQVETLKQQVDKLTKELSTTKSASGADKEKLEQKYGSALEQWKSRGEKMNEQLESGRAQAKKEATQRAELEEALKNETTSFSQCYENNKKLYAVNQDLLNRYQNKGFADVLGQKEPFTGIKQVDVENLIQDYQYQIDSLKIKNNSVDSINNSGGRVETP